MAVYPLPFYEKQNYHYGGIRFGASRDSGRKHAACDLIAPPGTPVYSVEGGTVLFVPKKAFFSKYIYGHHSTQRFSYSICRVRSKPSGGRREILSPRHSTRSGWKEQ